MTTTFDGLAYGIHTTDGFVPIPEREVIVSSEHIPWSNLNVVESGGLGPLTFRGTIRIAFSALASWRARVGLVKTSVIDSVSYGSMRLTSFTNIRRTPNSEYILVDVEIVGSS